MVSRLDEHLTAAIRASRHHHLSYFYHALLRHKDHETFHVEGWPRRRELGFTCECAGPIREWRINIATLKETLPEAREAFMRFRAKMRHGNKARRREQRRADRKARDLLHRFLTREQKWELRGTKAFTVKGGDGRVYEVGLEGTYLLKGGRRRYSFCVVSSRELLPRCDMLLAHKVLLEADPERFLRTAHVSDLDTRQRFDNGDFIVEHQPPPLNEVCEDAMNLVPLPEEVLDQPEPWVRKQIRQWWSEGRES